MKTIHLRPFAEQDRATCVGMFKGNTPRFFSMAELPAFEQFLTDLPHPFFVVENGDHDMIGCGGVTFVADKSTAGLCWGMVRNDMHKQGLGRFLLLSRLAYICGQSPDCLVTNDTNQYACGFFERMGFQVTKVTHDYYALDVHRYDMELQLNKAWCAKIKQDLEEYQATIRYV